MKICSILTFSLKCNTWLQLQLEFVLYNRVHIHSKTKSVLFSLINTQNVQKHTKSLNISFVVTLAGQNCGSLELIVSVDKSTHRWSWRSQFPRHWREFNIQFTRHWMEINNNMSLDRIQFTRNWILDGNQQQHLWPTMKIPVLHFYERLAESRLSYVK